jgi:DNA-binding beta-propeller fold protein YncE
MRRLQLQYFLTPALCVVLLSGCGGGSGTAPISSVPEVAGGALQAWPAAQGAEQSAASRRFQDTAAAPAPLSSKRARIYVADTFSALAYGGFVDIFPLDATGNVRPSRRLRNGLDQPYGIALNASRRIYVTNNPSYINTTPSVTVYSADSGFHSAPIQDISGSNAMLNGPTGIALDARSNMYVVNNGNSSVTVYAAGANGNVAPIRTISGANTNLQSPTGIARGAGSNFYVANSGNNSVTVYPKGANGNVAPIQTISGESTMLNKPTGIALDAQNNIYIANEGNSSVTVYAAGANGNVAPIQAIMGGKTMLDGPTGIALDTQNNIYVADNSNGSVTVYATGATGNIAPIQTISGNKTHLLDPFGIAVR